MRLPGLLLAGLVAAAPAAAAPPAAAPTPEARERLVAAVAAYRAAQYPAAARQFGEAADGAGPIAEYALYLQADSLARAGDAAAAQGVAVRAADRAGEGPLVGPALQLGAREAQRAGQAAAAVALYRRALDRVPDLPDAAATRLALGQALEGAGQLPEAARAYRELWLGSPAADEALAAAARERALADRGVTLAPPTARERVERAERLLAGGRAPDARAEAEALLGETPSGDLALRALRVVTETARRLGRLDDALRAVDRALAQSPAERRAPWLLERARLTSGRQRETGLATLERLVRDHPQSPEAPEALLLRAEWLEASPRPAEAEAGYRRLVQEYPDDERAGRALWRLGWLAWLRGDLAEAALRWGRLGAARGPLTTLREGGLYWAGRAHEARGDRAEAERLWATLLTEVPRGYYGLLAARRAAAPVAPAAPPRSGGALPAEPLELLRAEARWAKVEALRDVGLDEFVTAEVDEIGRRGAGDLPRLYAVSAAHAQDRRYHLALRIMRREFVPLARRGDAATPRAFWHLFYPIGWRTDVEEAAAHAGLDPFLVAAVTREESSYDPRARSRVGARGLMQLMPDTARPMAAARGMAWGGGTLLETPRANLELGAAFLGTLVRDFGDARLAVAAYNAGPRRVREWWAARRGDDVEVFVELIPFNETRFFVKRVAVAWEEYTRLYGGPGAGGPGAARPGRRP